MPSGNLTPFQARQTLPYSYSIYVIFCASFNQFLVVTVSEVATKRLQHKTCCTVIMNVPIRTARAVL